MNLRIAVLLPLISWPFTVLASPTDTPLQRGEEIGRYLGATRGAQQLTYRILDYCADTNPTKRENVARAKEGWDKRNLVLVTSWREVVRNWLVADKVAEGDVPTTIDQIDAKATTMLEALKPVQEEAVKVLAAKPPEEQTKTCALFVGFVIGGGRDIRVTSPAAMRIYEKFAPAIPNPVVNTDAAR